MKLAELLRQGSTLKPVLVTDAKAFYDSYHRESLVSSVMDRKFLWDPGYVAAKKKLLQERLRSQEEGSKKKKKKGKNSPETVEGAVLESDDVAKPFEVTDSQGISVDVQVLDDDANPENDSSGAYIIYTTPRSR